MDQVMYIGPNILRLGLTRNSVYYDGLPGHVETAIAEIPEIRELIVSIEDVTEAIHKTRTKGEPLNRIYGLVAEKAAKN